MSEAPPSPFSSRLEALVEALEDAVITIDTDGVVRSFNSGAERMFGYAAQEVTGLSIDQLGVLGPDETHVDFIGRYLKTGRAQILGVGREVEGRRKDGTRIPVFLSVSEVRADGEHCFIGVLRDLSALVRADEAVRVVSERLRLATEGSGLGIWDWDVIQDRLVWDAQMYRLYGISPESFSGAYEAWRAGLHPDDVAAGDAAVQRALRGEAEFDTEFRVIWPDGSIHVLQAKAQVQRDDAGEPLRMVGINWDITQLKQAEAELERQNRELELAARFDRVGSRAMLALNERRDEATPYGEVVQILADEAGYRPLAIYGWDEDEERLSSLASVSLAPGVSAASFAIGEGLVGEAAQRREPMFISGDASPFVLDTGFGVIQVATLFALPLLHGDALLGVLAGAKPGRIDERERSWLTKIANQLTIGFYAAEQYRKLRVLSAELDARASTIEAQNRELAQANRMKSEFLTTMSHELRTPLNAIIGFTNILLKNKTGTLQPKELSFLGRVLANSKHLLALINDILNLSKFEAGRLELELESVDLRELTREVLSDIGISAERPGRTLLANIPGGLQPVRADRRRLKQVMINLLGNAVKFTDVGTVEIQVVAEGVVPVRVDVIDSGIGIPHDQLGEVMDAFRQVDGGTSRRYGGTGLGLTISRTFCLAMGFELELDSIEGEGTVVSIRLTDSAPPLTWRSPATTGNLDILDSSERSEPRPKSKSERRTVLVIDDDPDARAVIQQYLDEFGCRVITVDSGVRGLEVARATRPALVTLDLMMRGMSGLTVLKAFRDDPQLRQIPVLVCSIVAGEYRYQLTHAVEVISKPIERELFGAAIERALGPSRDDGRRILIIDDDPDARKLFANLASELDLEISLAENGELGLEAVARERPDLIILDLMMPVLDGFGFLARLRAQPSFRYTPVIVCTAATLDREQRHQLEGATELVHKGEHAIEQLREILSSLLAD